MDLQELKDREALREAVLAFATAVDSLDMDLYRAAFAEEAEFDVSSFSGQPAAVVRVADWAAGMEGFLRGFDATQHILSNFAFEIAGDRATVIAAMQAEHFRPNREGDSSVTLGGDYVFRLARTPAGWKITGFRLDARWHRGNLALYDLAAKGPRRR
ncbi:MAG: hypothetical protein GC201_06300 [Alphaproteobacteria bacterium]|nr:hypothetical protein [Alphaproteobacteria bacterium]